MYKAARERQDVPDPRRRRAFLFGGEERQHEETVRLRKDGVLLIPKHTVYEYEAHM